MTATDAWSKVYTQSPENVGLYPPPRTPTPENHDRRQIASVPNPNPDRGGRMSAIVVSR